MNDYEIWACNLRNNTCIGCGNTNVHIVYWSHLDCRCNNKDDCYKKMKFKYENRF
jgi:hypothetical protein